MCFQASSLALGVGCLWRTRKRNELEQQSCEGVNILSSLGMGVTFLGFSWNRCTFSGIQVLFIFTLPVILRTTFNFHGIEGYVI